jgi:hypothetical protein
VVIVAVAIVFKLIWSNYISNVCSVCV